jgi:hypothetical protein
VTRHQLVGVIVFGARPGREELGVHAALLDPLQVCVRSKLIAARRPWKPRKHQMGPSPTVEFLPTFHTEIESKIHDPGGDVVVIIDDDGLPVDLFSVLVAIVVARRGGRSHALG